MKSALTKQLLNNSRLLKLTSILVRNVSNNFIIKPEHTFDIPNVTLHEFFESKFEKYAKFTAIECGITGRSYTYEQIRGKSDNFSKNLRKKLNLNEKEVVGILLPNIPEYVIAAFGVFKAGLVLTTLNPVYTPDEISKQFQDSNTKVIITNTENYAKVKAAVAKFKRKIPIIIIRTNKGESFPENTINYDEFVDTKVDISDIITAKSTDVAMMPYSSGTTGLPKGVLLTHRNLVANSLHMSHKELEIGRDAFGSYQDVIPAVLPFFHIYGFKVVLLSMMCHGSKIVTMPKFSPELYIDVLIKHKPNLIYTAPPLVLFLTLNPSVKSEMLKSIEQCICGAAPLGRLDEEKFLEKAGNHLTLLQGYGLTETSPMLCVATKKIKEKYNCYGSIGKSMANTEMKLVATGDSSGTALGPNQLGELLVRGPQVMQGYFNRSKETDEVFLDGWFRTGDLMEYNEDGLFFVKDRLKELIKVKGFQVAPAELEEILRDFPGIDDAAVIGIPHPVNGEAPRAYVVPKRDCKIRIEDLEKFIAEKVAPFKQLKGGIVVVDSIPKTPTGKILRRQLKLQYEQENV